MFFSSSSSLSFHFALSSFIIFLLLSLFTFCLSLSFLSSRAVSLTFRRFFLSSFFRVFLSLVCYFFVSTVYIHLVMMLYVSSRPDASAVFHPRRSSEIDVLYSHLSIYTPYVCAYLRRYMCECIYVYTQTFVYVWTGVLLLGSEFCAISSLSFDLSVILF